MRTMPDALTFVRYLRWFTGVFAVASAVVAVVLIVRAPDCIGIGFSLLSGQDCTNRDTYYLLVAGLITMSVCYTLLLLAASYIIDLLNRLASGEARDYGR